MAVADQLNYSRRLNSPDVLERIKAVIELSESKDPELNEIFLSTLEDKTNWVRWAAASHSGSQSSPKAIRKLIPLLIDPYIPSRAVAKEALKRIGREAVPELLAVLKDDSVIKANEFVAELLRLESSAGDRPARAGKGGLRPPVAELLGEIGDDRAEWPLVVILKQALENGDQSLLDAAAKALLGNFAWDLLDRVQWALLAVASRDWDWAVTLRTFAVEPLLAALRMGHAEAAKALGEIGDRRATPLLVRILETDPASTPKPVAHRKLQVAAAEALGKIRDPLSYDALAEAAERGLGRSFSFEDSAVPEAAVKALGELGDRRASAILMQRESSCAVEALGKIGDESAIPLLLHRLASDFLANRESVAIALYRLGWEPAANRERALKAISLRRWDDLPALGPAAVLPVLRAMRATDLSTRDCMVKAIRKVVVADGDKSGEALGWKAVGALRKTIIGESGSATEPLATPLLISILEDDSCDEVEDRWLFGCDDTQSAAAWVLGELRCQSALGALTASLCAKRASVRASAAQALGKIGNVGTIEPLLAALKDSRWEVRASAAEALGNLGKPEAIGALTALFSDAEPRPRLAAAMALVKLDRRESLDVVAKLLLSHKDYDIRREAAACLGRSGDRRGVTMLVAALTDSDARVGLAAVEALAQLGWQAADDHERSLVAIAKREWDSVASLGGKAAGALRAALARPDRDGEMHTRALLCLESIGFVPGSDAERSWHLCAIGDWDGCAALGAFSIEPLVSVLLDTSKARGTRASAAKTLGNIGLDVVARLLSTLDLARRPERRSKVHQEPWVVQLACALRNLAVADSLTEIDEGRVVSALLDVLRSKEEDGSASVRSSAAIALGDVAERMAVMPLLQLLKQRESTERARARALPLLLALQQVDEIEGHPLFSDRALRILLPVVREVSLGLHDSAVDALAEIDQMITVPLIEVLRSSDRSDDGTKLSGDDGGYWIINSLGKIGTAHAIWGLSNWPFLPVLVDALHCDDSQTRQSAARALGDIGDTSATDPLTDLASQDTSSDVRRIAIEALGTTGDRSSRRLLGFLSQKAKETENEEGRAAVWALNRINDRRRNSER